MENVNMNDTFTYAMKKIELARLDAAEISPLFQSLIVSEDAEDLLLLQLNKDVTSHLSEGRDLVIRGDINESAVLCTDNRTFELKEAETSNSLLLLPDMRWPEDCETGEFRLIPQKICGTFHTYLELRNFNPSFKKLRLILENNAYKGPEHEDPTSKTYRIEELLDVVQSSREELVKALNDLQACDISGAIRILDFDYKFNVLSKIVDEVESNSIPLNRLPKDAIIESLQEFVPKNILEKCFLWYTFETDDVDDHGSKLYAFCEEKVCRIYAEVLLRAAGKFNLSEFMESWKKSVPEGMKCDLSQLHGLALTDLNYRPEIIFHFPADKLPENIADRFTKLFKVKEKWSYDEIVPYLEDRAVVGNDVKSLLIKYTRESSKDGIKYYSSKW